MKKFYEIKVNDVLKEIAKKVQVEVEHAPMYKGVNPKYGLGSLYGKVAYTVSTPLVVVHHIATLIESNKVSPDKLGKPFAYDFYIDRLFAVPHYGEKSGTELLKLICRCAFADDVLTEDESISIINICHSDEWYKIFKEMDYNEGWN